jgi:hypothetical protein
MSLTKTAAMVLSMMFGLAHLPMGGNFNTSGIGGKKRRTLRVDKSSAPHGYPGAKLNRKAYYGKCTLRS